MNLPQILAAVLIALTCALPLQADETDAPKPAKSPSEKQLKLLKEPSLAAKADAAKLPAIRFTWVRTFHAPISLRAYMTAEGPRLRVARMSGKGGYDWGTLEFENDFPLAKAQWERLQKLIAVDGARKPLKGIEQENRNMLSGFDGAEWILEVSDSKGYTIEETWSPTSITDGKEEEKRRPDRLGIVLDLKKLEAYVAACKFFIHYAPMDPDGIY